MLVRIDVIEREAGRTIGLELRLDFRRDLPADRRTREYIEPEPDHVAAEPPASASTRSGRRCGGRSGRPSTSTRCRPTRNRGSRRARAIASSAAGAATMRLAAVRTPP